ncbi:MAG: hypothetical protein DLM62_10995, partial [Pseudonocardiales bacterium]
MRVTPAAAVNGAGGDRVQPGLFLGQHLGWGPAGRPVRPAAGLAAEHPAGRFQGGERCVVREQVRGGGHQVGLRDPDGGLAAALGLRVR